MILTVINLRQINRAAHTGAELVALKTGERQSGAVGEEIVGIQLAVAQVFEKVAVQLVGPGFARQGYHTAPTAAVFGRIGIRLDAELLDTLDRRNCADHRYSGSIARHIQRHAVHQDGAGRLLAAVHDEPVAEECVGDAGQLSRRGYARNQAGKAEYIAAVQRQILNPVAVHRWFERGEGWAYDPLCAARCGPDPAAGLNVLFDRQLKHPEPGGFLLRG